MFAFLLFEVVARYMFNSPTSWATEATTMLFVAYTILSGGYLLLHRGHIKVDIFYQQFSPRLNHTDEAILGCQQTIQRDYASQLKVSELASASHLTERTFLRRFSKATGHKPNEYIQRIRIQKACDLLESSQKTVELIASEVGYEDVSSCRRNFVRITGLSPSAFKQRFVASSKAPKKPKAKTKSDSNENEVSPA